MKKILLTLGVALAATMLVARAHSQSARARDDRRLSIEQLIDIRHPSNPMWSPDGRSVVFVWDRAGVSKVYVAATDAGARRSEPRELTDAGSSLAGASWSADGRALLMPRGGDLWRVPIDGSPASAVWTTPEAETGIVVAPDGSRVAFVRATGRPRPDGASANLAGGRGENQRPTAGRG